MPKIQVFTIIGKYSIAWFRLIIMPKNAQIITNPIKGFLKFCTKKMAIPAPIITKIETQICAENSKSVALMLTKKVVILAIVAMQIQPK